MTTRIFLAALLLTASAFGQGAGSVAVVPNVAALTNRPPSAVNPVVSLSGYHTNGDFGPARTIRYVPSSTATVDFGCVFPTSTGTGRWEAADCDSLVDPRWFDVHPDNVASVNSSNWANLGDHAYSVAWPRGRFLFDRPIILTNAIALNWVAPNGSYQGGWISTNSINEAELAYVGPATNIFVNLLTGFDGTGTNQMTRYGHQMLGISVNANRLAEVALAIGHVGRMELTRVRYNGGVGTNGYFEQIQFTKMQSCSTSKNDETPQVLLPARVGMSLSMDTAGIFSAASSLEDCVWESSSEWGLVLGPKAKNITITSGAVESNAGNGVAILTDSSGITMIGTWFENNGGTTNLWIQQGAYFNNFVGVRMSEDYTAHTYVDSSYNTFIGCLFRSGNLSANGTRNKFINCTYSDSWSDVTAGGNSYMDLINGPATVRTNTLSSAFVMFGEPFVLWNGTNLYARSSLRYNGVFFGDGSNPQDAGWFRQSAASLGTSNSIVMLAQGANNGLLSAYTPASAYPNLSLNVNGTLAWGLGGTNPTDVAITHAVAGELRVDGQFLSLRTNSSLLGWAVGLTNDTSMRVGLTGKGIEFGSGASARTAFIYYDSPATVLLRSNAIVEGSLTLGGVARSTWPSVLGTDTTGDYVATVSGTANEVTASGSGEGAAVTLSLPATIDLGGKTSFELPNAAAPTVDAFGEIAGDNDAWAAGRGAPVFYDGTAATRLVGVLASDTPTAGQVPKWQTGGTITWEDDTSGSGGSSTNLLVNTNLVTQANLIDSPTVMLTVDGSKIQAHVTNNLPAGWYANGFLPLHAGVSNKITGDLFRKQDSDIREPMWEDGTEWNAVGLRANAGKLSLGEFNTNDWTVLEEFIVVDPTDPTDDVITFGNSGFNNKVVFEADVDFQGTVTGISGTGDVVTTADNVLSGVNQFTNGLGQVFSVPPRVLGGRINGWTAPQMTPGTNAATQAQYKVLGDGVPAVEFDGTTSEEISMVGLLGQDPDRGSFVTITFASDDTANTVCWQAQWQLLTLRGIDTNLLSTAATWTSNIPGTARVPTNITFSLNAPTGLLGSTNDFSKPYMLRVTRLPGSDSSLSNAYLIGVDHRYGR